MEDGKNSKGYNSIVFCPPPPKKNLVKVKFSIEVIKVKILLFIGCITITELLFETEMSALDCVVCLMHFFYNIMKKGL